MVKDAIVVNGRYQLHEPLGEGGMGIVYRATDRLTGNIVALKQVLVEPSQLRFSEQTEKSYRDELQIVLAKEFQLLASLRHPYIVSVLDYGFDEAGHPYIVMDFLDHAQTILEAGRQRPFAIQAILLQQLLQAVTYLHRHKVLHHDLKPQNILVSDGNVRILDFGLASSDLVKGSSSGGTPFYTAPEVWNGETYTAASDLFAIGIIAYELLASMHPFAPLDDFYLDRLFDEDPDLTLLNAPIMVTQLIGRLLAKKPENRYQHALAVLQDLNNAMPDSGATEEIAIRESYLQAAAFVGREKELGQLKQALTEARVGHGSMWLVGGESGVGKSRLLNELRTLALVGGFQVLQGQAIRERGAPYQMWRDLVGHVGLQTALSELEAGVLKEIQPRLPKIRNEVIIDPPHLEGRAQQERLRYVLSEVLQRQTKPTLLLLEDVQWAQESLEPLRLLAAQVFQLPMLIVASYRMDERSDLPAQFVDGTHQMILPRFGYEGVTQLAAMMLGEGGSHRALVEQLIEQTEGNVFFLVETLRAWAEEVGGLQEVGKTAVLPQVLTGGMTQIIRHRLAKVPEEYSPLLKLMAIAGRQLDEQLLNLMAGDVNAQAWLLACNKAMVLTVEANQWQFAHDKLREVLLQDLTTVEKQEGHYRVANALETLYGENENLVIMLAEHWRQAGHVSKEITYSVQASKRLLWIGQHKQAGTLIERLLTEHAAVLTDTVRVDLLYVLGNTYREMEQYPKSIHNYKVGLALARRLGDKKSITQHLIGLGWSMWRDIQYEEAWDDKERALVAENYFLEALSLAQEHSDLISIGHCWHNLGVLLWLRDKNRKKALVYLQRSLALFQEADDLKGTLMSYTDIGILLLELNNLRESKIHYMHALALTQTSGNPNSYPYILSGIMKLAMFELDWDEVAKYTVDLFRFGAHPQSSFYHVSHTYAAMLAFHQRDYTGTKRHVELLSVSRYRRAWVMMFVWRLRGIVATLEADLPTLQLCLDNCIINAKEAEAIDVAYGIVVIAGYYLLNNDVERGAAWLTLVIDYLATIRYESKEIRGHIIDATTHLSIHFQDMLATPTAQAGQQRAAQLRLTTIIQEWDDSGNLNAEQVMQLVNAALFDDA